MSSSALGYQSCVTSNDWFISQRTIRCSPSFAATGYAPDPKDCSKYYSCDGFVGRDGMSSGKISPLQETDLNEFFFRRIDAMFSRIVVGSTTTNMCPSIGSRM